VDQEQLTESFKKSGCYIPPALTLKTVQFSLTEYISVYLLRYFEGGLRRIFGPRRDELTGEWRRLHNEELNDLYSSPNIERVI